MKLRERIYSILDRLFAHEVIDGHGRRAYLHRWVLRRLPGGRAVYLHHFVGSDWSYDLHDHPKAFTTIGLRGRYFEETRLDIPTYETLEGQLKEFRSPWFRRFPANYRHRLIVAKGETCWTLVYVGPTERAWGFFPRPSPSDEWVHWAEYVRSEAADRNTDWG